MMIKKLPFATISLKTDADIFSILQVQQLRGTLVHHQIIPRRMATTCTLKPRGLVNMATKHGW